MKTEKRKKNRKNAIRRERHAEFRITEIMAAPGMIEKGNRTCTEKPAKGKKQR